ncbi:MAG: hypothetical protein LH654_01670 [Thermoleophilia bacterium]|nr:hypothetical protein [Thermoleophilia bacterium]
MLKRRHREWVERGEKGARVRLIAVSRPANRLPGHNPGEQEACDAVASRRAEVVRGTADRDAQTARRVGCEEGLREILADLPFALEGSCDVVSLIGPASGPYM